MANFFIDPTLSRARPVLMMIEQNTEQYDESNVIVMVKTFAVSRASGFHLQTLHPIDRACNITGDTSSDGFRLTIGKSEDYDTNSNASKDSTTLVYYNYNEQFVLAKAVLKWLYLGILPARVRENIIGSEDG